MDEPEQPPKPSVLDNCLLAFAVIFVLGIIVAVLWWQSFQNEWAMHMGGNLD